MKHVKPNRNARHGMALLLVIVVIAGVAVISWGLLSSSSVTSGAVMKQQRVRVARQAAESAVAMAVYYLENPAAAPNSSAGPYNTHYVGESDLRLFNDGTRVTVEVANTAIDTFRVKATARTSDGEVEVTPVIATVKLNRSVEVTANALAANGSLTVPLGTQVLNGAIETVGSLVISPLASFLGTLLGSSGVVGVDRVVPTYSDLAIFSQTGTPAPLDATRRLYTWNGQTYMADVITESNVKNKTLLADATTNPANVWVADDAVTFENVNLNGTIVVRGTSSTRNLKLDKGTTITARPGMPAVVVGNTLELASSSNATINGLVWVNEGIKSASMASRLNVNGSVMFGSPTAAFSGSTLASIRINYDASLLGVAGFSVDGNQVTASIESWEIAGQ